MLKNIVLNLHVLARCGPQLIMFSHRFQPHTSSPRMIQGRQNTTDDIFVSFFLRLFPLIIVYRVLTVGPKFASRVLGFSSSLICSLICGILNHTLSYFVRLYLALSYFIRLCHTLSYFVLLCHTLSHFVILPYSFSYFVLLCLLFSLVTRERERINNNIRTPLSREKTNTSENAFSN